MLWTDWYMREEPELRLVFLSRLALKLEPGSITASCFPLLSFHNLFLLLYTTNYISKLAEKRTNKKGTLAQKQTNHYHP